MSVPGEWSGHAQSWPASESRTGGVGSTANNSKAAQELRNKLLTAVRPSIKREVWLRQTDYIRIIRPSQKGGASCIVSRVGRVAE